ncbi:MAG: hypothetical protein IPP47_21285 [Bryobacterales bacterium]|nr:hypothetical protein [Bryobacterales bacterium]
MLLSSPWLSRRHYRLPCRGRLFPPGFAPPTILWRDTTAAKTWTIQITFSNGAAPIRLASNGPRPKLGEIDPDCVSTANQPPTVDTRQHAWKPGPATWAQIQRHSTAAQAILTIAGVVEARTVPRQWSASAHPPIPSARPSSIATSRSCPPRPPPVPSSLSRHTPCAWSNGACATPRHHHRYARPTSSNYYVANFADYRFSRSSSPPVASSPGSAPIPASSSRSPAPTTPPTSSSARSGAPAAIRSVFARAKAQDPNPPGRPPAKFSNDPNELQIQYDLYSIPFNNGRGGQATPIAGASQNGMSNTFPKLPRWPLAGLRPGPQRPVDASR